MAVTLQSLQQFQGLTIESADGIRLFHFYSNEDANMLNIILCESMPGWWRAEFQAIGNMIDGDMVIASSQTIHVVLHDELQPMRSTFSFDRFFELLFERRPNFEDIIYESLHEVKDAD